MNRTRLNQCFLQTVFQPKTAKLPLSLTAYIFAALGYALFLTIFFNDIKKKVKALSKYFKCKKNVKSLTANKEYSGSEPFSSQASDDTEKSDASLLVVLVTVY